MVKCISTCISMHLGTVHDGVMYREKMTVTGTCDVLS
jgi:hypothetical protein